MSEKNNKFPIRTKLPAIEEGDPFKYCSFNRENAAKNLTNLLKLSEGGFVLAVDNQWGFGKTTFIKMWQQYLKNNKFNTIYFNSWENDFENKPLIAIISEIKNELSTENKGDNFNVVVKKISMLCNDLIKSKLGINITEIIEIFKEITNKENLINKEIEEYRNKRKAIEEFKEELSKYIRDIRKHNENPLIFIIDELDRCRPSYAIELLECIKHLFSIEEIIFVLSIDKQQLLSSVRGFYGSDTINAEEYLRKFIDIEYSLPSVIANEGISFEKSLFDKYFGNFKNISHISDFFSNSKLTARQKEKIFISVRIAINNTLNNEKTIEDLLIPLFILSFLKLQHIGFFNEIANLTLDPQVLVDKFDDLFFSLFNEPTPYLLHLIAPIIKLYILSRPNQVFPKKITSKLDKKYGIEGSTLSGFMTLYQIVGLNINFFLDKINLVDRINIS